MVTDYNYTSNILRVADGDPVQVFGGPQLVTAKRGREAREAVSSLHK